MQMPCLLSPCPPAVQVAQPNGHPPIHPPARLATQTYNHPCHPCLQSFQHVVQAHGHEECTIWIVQELCTHGTLLEAGANNERVGCCWTEGCLRQVVGPGRVGTAGGPVARAEAEAWRLSGSGRGPGPPGARPQPPGALAQSSITSINTITAAGSLPHHASPQPNTPLLSHLAHPASPSKPQHH